MTRAHWRRYPASSKSTEELPPSSPHPRAIAPPPPLVPPVQVPNCLDDKYPVGTRIEARWGAEPTWWSGVVVHSDIYSPRNSSDWFKRDRRIHVLYDNPDTWGSKPYVHLLASWEDAIRVEEGSSPPPAPASVPNIPPPSKASVQPRPQGTRRSSRLATSSGSN